MPDLSHVLPIVCPLLFLAGFADSIAGAAVPSASLLPCWRESPSIPPMGPISWP